MKLSGGEGGRRKIRERICVCVLYVCVCLLIEREIYIYIYIYIYNEDKAIKKRGEMGCKSEGGY